MWQVSGVLWITGGAALAMERASEEELVAGVTALFALFPQVRPRAAEFPSSARGFGRRPSLRERAGCSSPE